MNSSLTPFLSDFLTGRCFSSFDSAPLSTTFGASEIEILIGFATFGVAVSAIFFVARFWASDLLLFVGFPIGIPILAGIWFGSAFSEMDADLLLPPGGFMLDSLLL